MSETLRKKNRQKWFPTHSLYLCIPARVILGDMKPADPREILGERKPADPLEILGERKPDDPLKINKV